MNRTNILMFCIKHTNDASKKEDLIDILLLLFGIKPINKGGAK